MEHGTCGKRRYGEIRAIRQGAFLRCVLRSPAPRKCVLFCSAVLPVGFVDLHSHVLPALDDEGDLAGVWEDQPVPRPEFRAETRRHVAKLMKRAAAERMI